jgi:hypothetical protein
MDKFNIEKVQFIAHEQLHESLKHLQEIAHHIKKEVRLPGNSPHFVRWPNRMH